MRLQRPLIWLLVGALGLPILICVLTALAALLYAMEDAGGATFTIRCGIALFAAWIAALIGLIIVPAVQALDRSADDDEPEQ